MRFNPLPKTALVISALIFSTVIGNAQSVPGDKGPAAGGAPPAAPPAAASGPAAGATSTSPVGVGGSPTGNTAPGSTAGAPPPASAADKPGSVPTTSNAGTPGSSTPTTSPKSGSTAPPSSSAPASAAVNVTPEQKTVIRQTVINNNSAPRVANVNFNIGVGVAVPASVTFAPLPPTILSLNPAWQAYHYFVYHEDIVIVDPVTRQIIAVVRV